MLRTLALLLSVTAALAAADLNGLWLDHATRPDGSIDDTWFELHQDGTKLAGTVTNTLRPSDIHEGALEDGRITFSTGTGNRVTQYQGALEGGNLHLTATLPGGRTVEFHARPAPAGANLPPARLEPPALHDLPDNGLARTPPMGWNSWNKFAGRVDDAAVRATADALVSSGMAKAGYVYVNIDDTWQGVRDEQGVLHSNKKFPDMKALAVYVHAKGLKLGIYSSPGPYTCAGYPGSYGHEEQDAQTWAAWGIDYLKYDWCSAGRIYQNGDLQAVYQKMSDALRKTGRPIVMSFCEYGRGDVWKWGPKAGANLWRTTGDISDNWDSMTKIGFSQSDLASYAGPGHWNDPDMLEVGNGGMTAREYRTHMSLWSLLAAPLLAGNDLSAMDNDTLSILTNPEVIAIDQDSLGRQGHRISKIGETEVWDKPLASGAHAIGLFNRGASLAYVSVVWATLGFERAPRKVRDVWARQDLHLSLNDKAEYAIDIPSHGVVLLRVQP